MSECCDDKSCEVDALHSKHFGILKTVLAINLIMFVVEAWAGYLAKSSSLFGDSLDMFGDALSYSLSLYVLGKGERKNAQAALFKGMVMLILSLSVFADVVYKFINPVVPHAETIGIIGTIALAANLICLGLLWKAKDDDLNMNSVWLCSRNDILVNLGVIASAVMIYFTNKGLPDLIVGTIISMIILKSSLSVIKRANQKIKSTAN